MIPSLLSSHGIDDGLNLHQFTLVKPNPLQALQPSNPGNHIQDAVNGSHFLDPPNLVPEILQAKGVLSQLSLQLLGLLLVEGGLGFLDQRKDIPHSQYSRGHPVGVKHLECVQFLPGADEFYGLPRYPLDGQRCTPPCITLHFREDNPVNVQRIVK